MKSGISKTNSLILYVSENVLLGVLDIFCKASYNVNSDSTENSFRNLYFAYLFTISYNDIYNKRQTQHFIVSLHGRQHQIPDSLFKEKFTDTEYLTFADATEEGLNKILSKLSQAEDQTIPRKKD